MWFPLTPTICVPFLKTRGRPSSEKRLSFCKYRTNHYFWMALILERNQQTGSMEINYWIRTGHAHPPEIFYFQFLSGQSVIINLFHPTSAEDRLVVVKRRICTRYLNYFNLFNVFAINEATFVSRFRAFLFFASRRIASNILPAYIPPRGSMTEWTYFANLFPPFRIGFSIVKGDACYTVFTYRSNLKTRMYVYTSA